MRYPPPGRLRRLALCAAVVFACSCNGSIATTDQTPPPSSFTLKVNVASASLAPGGTQSVSVSAAPTNGFSQAIQVAVSGLPSGVTASPSSFTLMPGSPQQVSLTAVASAPADSTTLQFAGTSGALTAAASLSLSVTPSAASTPASFSLSANPGTLSLTAGSSQSISIAATSSNGFSQSIQVAATGLPSGVTASPSSFALSPGTPQQVTITAAASAPLASVTVQFAGTSGTLTGSTGLTLSVTAAAASTPASFSLSADPGTLSLTAGSTQSVSIAATPSNGFSQSIQVAVTGLPSGVTASTTSFALSPGTPQQVTFSATASAPAATATVQFTGTSGTLTSTTSLDLAVTAAATPADPSNVDITTYHEDIGRTGLNSNETTLTPGNVTSSKFGLLRLLSVDGKVDAQPLYLSNLSVGGNSQNVVFVATEHDSVYAFNADTGAQLWKTSVLGADETTSDDHGCGQISPEIGITSTPVIDRDDGPHGAIFVVGMSQDPSGAYHQRLHALDVTTGAELSGSPTEITATYPGTGDNSSGGKVVFDPGQYAERASLLLMNHTIYTSWTSHCDLGAYTGWLMAYGESTLAQSAVLNVTPNGTEGSIWMSGAGLAADSTGNLYFLDANGTFDTTLNANGFPVNGDFGNGFIKVSTTGGNLAVADYFEPSNTVNESYTDQDLGSGGALVLPDLTDSSGSVHHLAVGAGKDENIYVVNRDNMGKFNSQNDDAVDQQINGAVDGVFSMPAYFNNTVYYAAVGDELKAFPISNAMLATAPSAHGANSFAFPGATPSVSANGTTNGIVWAVENSSPAVLYAYDATTLQELYDSNQANNNRDRFGDGNKFITPVITDGKVFVGTPTGVAEFGLFP